MNDIQLIEVLQHTFQELGSGRNSEADNTSSYSDLSLWKIHPEFLKDSRKALLAVITISFLGLNPIQEHTLKVQIMKICHKYHYLGKWQIVSEFLLLKFIPAEMLRKYFTLFDQYCYFGNDLKTMKKIWKTLKVLHPYEQSRRPVKYPKRKRGYDDKGHLSGDSHGANIPGIDNRRPLDTENVQLTNTLWFSDLLVNKEQQGTMGENTTSRKEKDYERKTNSTPNRNGSRQNPQIETPRELSERFTWRGEREKARIISSLYFYLNKKQIRRWKPIFLLYYIFWIEGKPRNYYGNFPSLSSKQIQQISLIEFPSEKSLKDYSYQDLKELFSHI